MQLVNLTPHDISLVKSYLFTDLVVKGTLITATGVMAPPEPFTSDEGEYFDGLEYVTICSSGSARVSTDPKYLKEYAGFPVFDTVYGELDWGCDISEFESTDCLLIVSGLFLAAAVAKKHPLSAKLVTPHGVVRDASNTSNVLGCTGLSFVGNY